MGQTSDPETLVIHQETTPGNNPEDFKQHLSFCNFDLPGILCLISLRRTPNNYFKKKVLLSIHVQSLTRLSPIT
jgi:hypothetical protein